MHYPFYPITLPYNKNSLEPFLSSEIIYYHYCKHYISYIESLNGLLAKFPTLQNLSLEELIVFIEKSSTSYRNVLLNYAGGVYNHQLYFKCLTSNTPTVPENEILFAIKNNFGSYNTFVECFSNKAKTFVGSGYLWLVDSNSKLEIISSINQNTPLSTSVTPLLNLDLWEHSYYLQYKNNRKSYIDNWFNIINWCYINKRYISSF